MQREAKLFIVVRHPEVRPTEKRVIHYNSVYWVQEYREDPHGGFWRTVLSFELTSASQATKTRSGPFATLPREIA